MRKQEQQSYPPRHRIVQRALSMRSGSEGPRHDPYSWSTLTVTLNGVDHTLRLSALGGISYRREARDGTPGAVTMTDYPERGDVSLAQQAWERAVGMTVSEFGRAYDRIHRDDIEDPMGDPSHYI